MGYVVDGMNSAVWLCICVCVNVREESMSDRDESKSIKLCINHGFYDLRLFDCGIGGLVRSFVRVDLAILGSIEPEAVSSWPRLFYFITEEKETLFTERWVQNI